MGIAHLPLASTGGAAVGRSKLCSTEARRLTTNTADLGSLASSLLPD